MTGTQKATPWLLKRNALPFHSSPTDGGNTLGAFAHSLCGYGHLRTLDCECWGCREIVNALLPVVTAFDAMREALEAVEWAVDSVVWRRALVRNRASAT